MAKEYVIERFLDATGKLVNIGDDVPGESAQNLERYRALGLIGDEAAFEARYPGKDVGRRGKAANRKGAKPAESKPAAPAETK